MLANGGGATSRVKHICLCFVCFFAQPTFGKEKEHFFFSLIDIFTLLKISLNNHATFPVCAHKWQIKFESRLIYFTQLNNVVFPKRLEVYMFIVFWQVLPSHNRSINWGTQTHTHGQTRTHKHVPGELMTDRPHVDSVTGCGLQQSIRILGAEPTGQRPFCRRRPFTSSRRHVGSSCVSPPPP